MNQKMSGEFRARNQATVCSIDPVRPFRSESWTPDAAEHGVHRGRPVETEVLALDQLGVRERLHRAEEREEIFRRRHAALPLGETRTNYGCRHEDHSFARRSIGGRCARDRSDDRSRYRSFNAWMVLLSISERKHERNTGAAKGARAHDAWFVFVSGRGIGPAEEAVLDEGRGRSRRFCRRRPAG